MRNTLMTWIGERAGSSICLRSAAGHFSRSARLVSVALPLFAASACTYHHETTLDLKPRSAGDAKPTAQRSARLLPVRALKVRAPAAGEKLFGIRVMEQGSVNGYSYGPLLRATDTYTAGTDIAPLIAHAMDSVVKIDPGSSIEVEANSTFDFDAYVTDPAWYEWYQHRHAKVIFKLQLIVMDHGSPVLDKEISASSSEEFTWSLGHTPSDELIERLVRTAIERAVEKVRGDREIQRLGMSV